MKLARVQGLSMVPTLHPGQFLLVVPRPDYRRGDLVIFTQPTDGAMTVKRIIGLPREMVVLRNDKVFINGTPLSEPYVHKEAWAEPQRDQEWRIGPDKFLVLGDGRGDSLDSRRYGPILRGSIHGRVAYRVWPWQKF